MKNGKHHKRERSRRVTIETDRQTDRDRERVCSLFSFYLFAFFGGLAGAEVEVVAVICLGFFKREREKSNSKTLFYKDCSLG